VIFLFEKAPVLSFLQEAKGLIKKSGSIPVKDVKRELTRRKILRKTNTTYFNNLFHFCQNVLATNQTKSQYAKHFNEMLNFIESCDILDNCNAFVPQGAVVLSNIPKLSTYTGNNVDMVLLKAAALTENSAILDKNAIKILAFAKQNNIPVYLVASIFSIDNKSQYHPKLMVDNSLFDGVISEHGFENFDIFMQNSRKSFNWLFF
jgi:hypothetical protein